eukprot:m.179234 g.179234  ORF g.179234 m.179234 type:complete len:458 (-) comp14715_c0_seq1:59-1432(-)
MHPGQCMYTDVMSCLAVLSLGVLAVGASTSATLQCSTTSKLRTNGHDIMSLNTTDAAGCCAACANTTQCTYFTFVASRNLCWLKYDGLGGSQPDPDCTSGSVPPRPCTSDKDCNHAGTCESNGTCVCDPPFYGRACESFALYSYPPGEGGLMIATGNTTWGGSVVEADDGSHHMFAAMMSGNGTLGTWLSQSVVAHAVSKTGPQGPYIFSDVALGPRGDGFWDGGTCHNPDVKRAPDGTYLIYYMGSHSGGAGSEFNQRIGIASSSSPYGPWHRSDPVVLPGPKGKWDDGFTTNPAPYIYPNGSVLLVYKARSTEHSSGMLEGVAMAETWNSTYVKLTPDTPLDLPTECEDAGIYRAPSGVFRMLTHCGCTGQYMWSLDGIAWSRTTSPQPWCNNIEYIDGKNGSLTTRQRPKWLTDSQGVATHVFTGVNRPGDSAMGHTWTMAAAVSMPAQPQQQA